MNDIHIYYVMSPKRGRRIVVGHYDYIKSDSGLPAMRTVWKGSFFSSEPGIFVFAQHATKFTPVDDEASQAAAKWLPHKPPFFPGIIGLAIGIGSHAIRSAKDFSGTKGFAFTYTNSDGHVGLCWAIASAAYVEGIVASIPADRIDSSIVPRITR